MMESLPDKAMTFPFIITVRFNNKIIIIYKCVIRKIVCTPDIFQGTLSVFFFLFNMKSNVSERSKIE